MGDRYEIRKDEDGKDHLIEKGFLWDTDIGELHESFWTGNLYTSNLFSENYELDDKGIIFTGDNYDVEKSTGDLLGRIDVEEATLKKTWLGDYKYKKNEEVKDEGLIERVTREESKSEESSYDDDYDEDDDHEYQRTQRHHHKGVCNKIAKSLEGKSDYDLRGIAKDDNDSRVRREAVKRVTDDYTLRGIAKDDNDPSVRREAVKRVTDDYTLKGIAKDDNDPSVRIAAVTRIRDNSKLEYIAKYDNDPEVRRVALILVKK